jgi:hypothetical protein
MCNSFCYGVVRPFDELELELELGLSICTVHSLRSLPLFIVCWSKVVEAK